jgi:hypothetical protein
MQHPHALCRKGNCSGLKGSLERSRSTGFGVPLSLWLGTIDWMWSGHKESCHAPQMQERTPNQFKDVANKT